MGEQPSGTVTFLFTDIEGSTQLWQERPEEMRVALAEHDSHVRGAIERCGGYVFATGGDGFAAAFPSAAAAVEAAASAQDDLADHPFVRVRMGIHTGEVQERDGDYFGPAVNQAARVMAAGHGRQVLLSGVAAALAEGDFVDLGEHPLPGIEGLVGIHQLGRVEHAALRVGPAGGLNLPIYRTSFIGREEVLASITSALDAGSLVTLTGVGGVGKTRLAIEVAARVGHDFPGGVCFAGLGQLGDGSALPITVLSALGLDGVTGEQPLDVLASFVGDRRMLLVLDNCEHVISDAADAVETLLDRCAGLTVLATSREGLAVPGERLVAVPPLSGRIAEGEARSERLRMLIDRAVAANPSVSTTGPEQDALKTIADELDGVPLAMELAAARLSSLTPSQVAERLGDRFRLLTGGRRSRERHQTLRATVQWSYDLLDEPGQRLFDELSVFSDGFTLELALLFAADLDEVDVLDIVEDLVQKSMLVFDTAAGDGRYRMLMTLCQFGQENLDDAGRLDEVRSRWANAFEQYIARLADALSGETELASRRAIHAEWSNIASLCEWSLSGGEIEPAVQVLAACFQDIGQSARTRLVVLARELMDVVPETSDVYAGALGIGGWAFTNTGDLEEIEAWLAAAERVGDDLANRPVQNLAQTRTTLLAMRGEQSAAVEFGLRQLEEAVARGDTETEALILAILPFHLTTAVRFDEAEAMARRAIERAGELERRALGALAAAGLGFTLSWLGSPEAIPVLEAAIAELRLHGWAFMVATSERALAQVITTTGDPEEAASLLLRALNEMIESEATMYHHVAVFYSSNLFVRQERWEDAAIASGIAERRLSFITSPLYSVIHQQNNEAISAHLEEQNANQLRAKGASMTNDELIAWARQALQ